MTYRAVCVRCNEEVCRFDRLDDPHVTAMLEHLWTAHPDVLRRPQTMLLGDLLREVRVRMA